MKYLNNILFICLASSLLVACGSKGFSKSEAKAAKKACSCWSEVAKQAIKIDNYKDQFEGKETFSQSTLDEMTAKKEVLKTKAELLCYKGWLRDQDDYSKNNYGVEGIMQAASTGAFCPEVTYYVNGAFTENSSPYLDPFHEEGKDVKAEVMGFSNGGYELAPASGGSGDDMGSGMGSGMGSSMGGSGMGSSMGSGMGSNDNAAKPVAADSVAWN